jgi:acyl-CoA dehydrogenase
MNERHLLERTVADLFAAYAQIGVIAVPDAAALQGLWADLSRAGLTGLSIPETAGGSGGTVEDVAVVLRAAGRVAAPLPLVETMLIAGPLAVAAGIEVGSGPITVAGLDVPVPLRRDRAGWTLTGTAAGVPWARLCERVLVVAECEGQHFLVDCRPDDADLSPATNVAGEYRDDLTFRDVHPVEPYELGVDVEGLRRRGALGRTLMMCGALQTIGAMSVRHVVAREQFGRPLARFQAVQQQLALMSGEIAAAIAAADMAVAATALADATTSAGDAGSACLWIAVAKVRAAEAVDTVARNAHQVHGALGFTEEFPLHRLTTRLWAWREEYGHERDHADHVAGLAFAAGPDGLWDLLTAAGDVDAAREAVAS